VGVTNTITAGLAQFLADLGHGSWNPAGVYSTGQTGIYVDAVPEDRDAVITLTAYPVAEPVSEDSMLGVQIRTRLAGADPRPVRDLDDQIMADLHGRHSFPLGVVWIADCLWQSGTSLGQDASKRWSWSSNYYLSFVRLSSFRF
jgi:hypothetical protein